MPWHINTSKSTPWQHDTKTSCHHDAMAQWHHDTMRPRHCDTPWLYDTMTPWHHDIHDIMALRHNNTVTPREQETWHHDHRDTVAPWHQEIMTQCTMNTWRNDIMALWHQDPMVLWHRDTATPWHHAAIRSRRSEIHRFKELQFLREVHSIKLPGGDPFYLTPRINTVIRILIQIFWKCKAVCRPLGDAKEKAKEGIFWWTKLTRRESHDNVFYIY
jgi:hypothetical protein